MAKSFDQKKETHSEAWARFERAVDVVAKSPPQHRSKNIHPKAKRKPEKSVQKNDK